MSSKVAGVIQIIAACVFLLIGLLYMGQEILNDLAYIGFAAAFGFGSNGLYLLKMNKTEQ